MHLDGKREYWEIETARLVSVNALSHDENYQVNFEMSVDLTNNSETLDEAR